MLGAGAVFSTVLTAFRYTNGFKGDKSADVEEDEVDRKERLKKNRRQPISETIEQLGEGRGTLSEDVSSEPLTDCTRNLRPRLGREETRAHYGQVWHRREGCPRDELDASVLCLQLKTDGHMKPLVEDSGHFSGSCVYIQSVQAVILHVPCGTDCFH